MRRRGFTLLEGIVALATLGVLASVAVPTYRICVLRAQEAERDPVMRKLEESVFAYHREHGRFPISAATAESSWIWAEFNPPLVSGRPTSAEKSWDLSVPLSWKDLPVSISGRFRYHYAVWGMVDSSWGWLLFTVKGDLDEDGIVDLREREYMRFSEDGDWKLVWELDDPTEF
jgi:prepilin-type N-terminal cleavage/methylation domain-containing protein